MDAPTPTILNRDELFAEFKKLLLNVPHKGDPIIVVLKAHLCFEGLLYKFLSEKVVQQKYLENAKLRFEQLVNLAEAFTEPDKSAWEFTAVRSLNRLRNTLAHNLDNKKFEERLNEFTNDVLSHDATPGGTGLVDSGFSRHYAAIMILHMSLTNKLLMKLQFPSIFEMLANDKGD